ncbi:MAG: ribosome recycling factor [Bacteroidia bacterium]|nr:ribosome recycling factor [Bacteroidia bacterium]
MSEEVQLYLDDARQTMNNALVHLDNELVKIRAGKANPHMLDGITVDYYGVMSPLSQVSNISTPDARTIFIQPWDKSIIEPIEKAIQKANLGFNPVNNGEVIRIAVPPLTEERRKQLVKQVKTEGEAAKVSIRNVRRDTNEELKTLKKEGIPEDEIKKGEEEVQKLTDGFIKKVDELLEKKEKEIMTV